MKIPQQNVAATAALKACSSSTTREATSTASSPSVAITSPTTTVAAAPCPTTLPEGVEKYTNADIQAALESAPLPSGVMIVNEIDEYNTDDRSMINVLVYVCQPGLVGDPLKDAATIIARALKASPVSEQIQELRVSNWADRETDQTARVRVDDFQMYTFSAEADPGAVRSAWKYPSEE